MQILEDTDDRLVIRAPRPTLLYILTAGAAFGAFRAATATEDFEGLGHRLFVGALFVGLGVLVWWGMPAATLVLDRSDGMAVLAHDRIGRRTVSAFPLTDLRGATTESRNGRTRRAVLLTDERRIPIVPSSSTGIGPRVAAEAIEEWLSRPQ